MPSVSQQVLSLENRLNREEYEYYTRNLLLRWNPRLASDNEDIVQVIFVEMVQDVARYGHRFRHTSNGRIKTGTGGTFPLVQHARQKIRQRTTRWIRDKGAGKRDDSHNVAYDPGNPLPDEGLQTGEQLVLVNELQARIDNCLASLPEEQRIVLSLSITPVSVNEIVEITGLPALIVIERLSDDQRDELWNDGQDALDFPLRLSNKDIGPILELPADRIAARKNAARNNMKQCMEKYLGRTE